MTHAWMKLLPDWKKASMEERQAAFSRIADPDSPDYIPFYARPENLADWNMTKWLVDTFGTHLICPRTACRRAGHCSDESRDKLPFCFWHYRGAIRFCVMAKLEASGFEPGALGGSAAEEEGPGAFSEPKPVPRRSLSGFGTAAPTSRRCAGRSRRARIAGPGKPRTPRAAPTTSLWPTSGRSERGAGRRRRPISCRRDRRCVRVRLRVTA